MRSYRGISAIQRKWQWCFRKFIAPVFRHTATLLLRWSTVTPDPSEASVAWKQKALDDFGTWLAALPEMKATGEPDPQSCDLYTLLLEFAALRQEIKLQSRQQRTTLHSQENFADRFQSSLAQFDERIAGMDRIHDENWRLGIENAAVLPFLDIRDALIRGLTAARSVAEKRSFWQRPPKSIDTVVEGYAMALRRFDRSLDRLGILAIDAVHRPFDAACMRAVNKRKIPDQEPGIVLEVTLGGFTRSGKVLRTAEVVVNG